ncbi:MAG: hypothetical protein AUK47_10790 [Deltaproteobacteria bacterium CG2_30_63_29]|nr:MAG: hypothetical protein AUK47_10790 [Deltaproteobacteria bacterium CG2_30_63_29]PJB41230.1 MAG: hypothetical protein CO108_13355 [Deltaproteobacteria bacterium CG_4_9_14_3_um_filter_63_12]
MDIELHELDLRYAGLRVNNPTRYARLVASLAQDGQRDPVLVVRQDERFVLIDGYARVRALGALGRDVVAAVILELNTVEALVLTWRLEVRGRRSALEDGWLVAELIDTYGWGQGAVAERLQRSKSWVSRRLALVRTLSDAVQDAVRKGRIPAHAAMKHLVPLARANASDCEAIVAGLDDMTVSVRQVERLYMGYKRADALGRQRLAANPRLFLQADEASRAEPDLDDKDPAKPLIDDLEAIAGLSRRARRRLSEGLLDELDSTRLKLVAQAGREASVAFSRVIDGLEGRTCSSSTSVSPF